MFINHTYAVIVLNYTPFLFFSIYVMCSCLYSYSYVIIYVYFFKPQRNFIVLTLNSFYLCVWYDTSNHAAASCCYKSCIFISCHIVYKNSNKWHIEYRFKCIFPCNFISDSFAICHQKLTTILHFVASCGSNLRVHTYMASCGSNLRVHTYIHTLMKITWDEEKISAAQPQQLGSSVFL